MSLKMKTKNGSQALHNSWAVRDRLARSAALLRRTCNTSTAHPSEVRSVLGSIAMDLEEMTHSLETKQIDPLLHSTEASGSLDHTSPGALRVRVVASSVIEILEDLSTLAKEGKTDAVNNNVAMLVLQLRHELQ